MLIAGLFVLSCDKDIQNPFVEPYAASSLDDKAGSWKPYILTNVHDIVVPEPKGVTDPAYLKDGLT
jgi:hypothetical protein